MLKIIAHHVGARGFGVSLNLPTIFGSEVVHVLYEADADAVKRMGSELDSAHARMLSEKYVLPYCLGSKHGKALLNITRNSYASSLFPPDEKFHKYYCEIPIDAAIYDIPYRAMLEVVRQVEVEVHSLDELLARGKVPISQQPDFLSLDTQGYELEILKGAQKTIDGGVLGIISEVEMIPIYAKQPLLGDILNFASSNGFIFAGFTSQYSVSPYRGPLGARGKGFPGFGDVLFLRDIDTLSEDRLSVDQLYVMFRKLSFIAISFGFIEYAKSAVDNAEKLRDRVSPSLIAQSEKFKYSKFLDEYKKVIDTQEALFPPVHAVPDDSRPNGDLRTSWYDKYHQASLRRYSERISSSISTPANIDNVINARRKSILISRLKQSSLVRAIYRMLPARLARRLLRYISPELLVASQGIIDRHATANIVPHMSIKTYTPVEELLDNWGFASIAHIVRQRRIAAEPYVRSLSSEMVADGQKAHIEKS